MHLERI